MASTIPITPDVNLQTFKRIILWILQQDDYKHLFNESDRQYLDAFDACSEKSQHLFINLYLRKHQWIRTRTIVYPGIANDLSPYFLELKQRKFLESCDLLDNLKEILNMMDQGELKTLLFRLKVVDMKKAKTVATKPEMIQALTKHANSCTSVLKHFSSGKINPVQMAVIKEAKKILGSSAYRLANEAWELFSRLTYLYYPPQVNEDEQGQVLSYEFFITNKMNSSGSSRYAPYKIKRKTVIYQERDELIDYERACRLESKILSTVEKKEWDKIESLCVQASSGYSAFKDSCKTYSHVKSMPTYLRNATAGHVFLRCISHLIGAFESMKMHQQAVALCKVIVSQDVVCLSYKGKFYERLAIDLERHLKKPGEALQFLVKAMQDKDVKEHFRYALYSKAKKLVSQGKSCKDVPWNPRTDDSLYDFKYETVTIFAPAVRKDLVGRKTVFLRDDSDGTCSVESAALNHYKKNGYTQGIHSEGSVFHSLFGLLMWDQIYYDELDDAFRTNQQKLPLDFVSEDFYLRRKDMIDARFDQLENMAKVDVSLELTNSWTNHKGLSSPVNWYSNLEQLKEIAYCIGMKPLCAIFRRLCSNFRCNRSGFPDLIVWSAVDQKVLSVEVKGPGDSLSFKQIMWLDFFARHGLKCEVAYVKPQK